ncbi:PPA1309 family protein [Propionibacteriaceae bacterium G1746]|uniref:PPA1309 family protein n=1 Tax=Aestuariimicrobium sp. G57 TaxID=3418485 RepID=UPI003C29B8F6
MSDADMKANETDTVEAPDDANNVLIAALMDIERHVTSQGWDQPARLFALVRTDELVRNEPSLAAHLTQGNPDSLSSIEQEDFHAGGDLPELLATLGRMSWPASVFGCALALERAFLAPQHESEIPQQNPDEFVANHPQRQDMRIVVGALRDGARYGVARLLSHPDDLLGTQELAPDLIDAVAGTLT